MKKLAFILYVSILYSMGLNAQTLVANPQNSSGEGGQLNLMESNSTFNPWSIDNYFGHLRFFHSGATYFSLSPSGDATFLGSSSPNIELKNTNYSNGGFVLNRTNYGNQWKWWAQSNVMYFDFSTDETNYSNKFTLKSNGNVGINNTDPKEKLQIGNAFTFHDGGHKVMSFGYAPTGGVDLDNTKYAGAIRFDTANGNLRFDTSSSVTGSPSSRMYINKDGNIGIGTSSPKNLLHVQSLGGNNQVAKIRVQGTGENNAATVSNASMSGYIISGTADDASFGRYNFGMESWYGIGFKSSFNNKAGIVFNTRTASAFFEGNVGIGTDAPDSKLTVAGNIHTREVKVTVDAGLTPDYVFKDDYNLKTLTEVEHYILEEGHLPNIPSATEIEENGLLLKDMNLKLLEKIEELTLYTIQQEKRIHTLEEENNVLKQQESRIALLEKKLAALLDK
ncbi:hypothetical protein MHTCC0001_10140 [Flavobacteriaceae bacterium MHTCC 0001]